MQISIEELNELLEKEFERGRNSVQKEKTENWIDIWTINRDSDYIPIACKTCPNHPSNGGSGICNCILGTEITYSICK